MQSFNKRCLNANLSNHLPLLSILKILHPIHSTYLFDKNLFLYKRKYLKFSTLSEKRCHTLNLNVSIVDKKTTNFITDQTRVNPPLSKIKYLFHFQSDLIQIYVQSHTRSTPSYLARFNLTASGLLSILLSNRALLGWLRSKYDPRHLIRYDGVKSNLYYLFYLSITG